MAKKFDQNEEIAILSLERHLLLMKIDKLKAAYEAELRDKERKIEKLEQILEKLDGDVMFYSDELEAKEREVLGILKQKLEEQDDIQLERKKALFHVVKYELVKEKIKKLLAEGSELENKVETQDNMISQRLVDENKQVGHSSGANAD